MSRFLLSSDIDECALQTDNCNGTAGEVCDNIGGSFLCECDGTQDLGRVNGVCQGKLQARLNAFFKTCFMYVEVRSYSMFK